MHVYRLERKILLPIGIEEAWEFFSTPENLNLLTPDDLQFEILTDVAGQKMYPGMIINYKVSPFAGIKFNWTTEISHCRTNEYFVDEQRFGPYAFWHHQHHFEEQSGKVLMTDIVHYALPLGFLGRIAHALFVRKKLQHIFDYRSKKVTELWK
jgi:ligand-binding SRPBCC domain-containing protein